jgi:hypothetical protein
MRRQLALITVLSITTWISVVPVSAAQQPQTPSPKKGAQKSQQSTLTGCVDQVDGEFVLIQELNRSLIAHLEAEGFPAEGFAKHVGHKVTVRGTSSSSGAERPVFKVRSVQEISDACGPQQ